MKIKDVRVFVVDQEKAVGHSAHSTLARTWLTESVISSPLSGYPEYAARRSSWQGMNAKVVVEIVTDEGLTGLGLTTGGMAAAVIIRQHLRRFLVDQSPLQVERLWDIMFKATLPYGRKGMAIHAISAVDLALWDLIAKAQNVPLYQALGGPVKDKAPAYATSREAAKSKGMGFRGVKLPTPCGAADGREGMRRNEEMVREAREILGMEMDLMIDCYMSWDVEYTLEMAERLAPYRLTWIEEPLPPDDYEGYGRINRKLRSTVIATGEHEYTRYGFRQLLQVRGAEILQPDLCWCGGLTEARKIMAMVSANHQQVTLHAGGLQPWAVHFTFSQPDIPMVEYMFTRGEDQDNYDPIFEGVPAPENGWFSLPAGVGAGIRLRDSAREFLQEVV